MEKIFALGAACAALIGAALHALDWVLNMFVLETVDFEGPLQTLADVLWLGSPLSLAAAIVLLALAFLFKPAAETR